MAEKLLYPNADVTVDIYEGRYNWAVYLCGWHNAQHGQEADYESVLGFDRFSEAALAGYRYLDALQRDYME